MYAIIDLSLKYSNEREKMNDRLAAKVKVIYSRYHANEISADYAMGLLELVIAESNATEWATFQFARLARATYQTTKHQGFTRGLSHE